MNYEQAAQHNATLSSARIKERNLLKNMLSFSVDAHTQLHKHIPKTGMIASIQKAVEAQKAYGEKLVHDETKTSALKVLMAAKYANGMLHTLHGQFDTERGGVVAAVEKLEKHVSSELDLNNTTKILIAQNQLQALQGLKWSNALELMRAGDAETIRAMALPLARMQYDIATDPKKQDAIRGMAEKVFLDGDEYNQLEKGRKALAAYEYLRSDLSEQFAANAAAIESVESSIVEVA